MEEYLKKYKLRFFFDYGAGGCLWSDNDLAYQDFGFGPIDKTIAEKTGKISEFTLMQIKELDELHSNYLNKDYPPDPSLWRQIDCDSFNEGADKLLQSLRHQLKPNFYIENRQIRYSEDEDLDRYLKDPKQFKRKT